MEHKSTYRSNIWEQFTNNIRTASRTDNLAEWYAAMCHKLPITIRLSDAPSVERILTSGDDDAMLHQLRKKTDLLVVMLQVINEERKAEWKKNNCDQDDGDEKEEETEGGTDATPLF